MLPALGVGLALSAAAIGVALAARAGMAMVELSLVGGALIFQGAVLTKRLQGRSGRGALLAFGRSPEAESGAIVRSLPYIALGLFASAIFIDGSLNLMGAARMLAVAEMFAAPVLLRPGGPLFEGGVMGFSGFTPWNDIESFRNVVFDKVAVFTFRLRDPGWFSREVTVSVPRTESEEVRALLSKKLPCLGVQDTNRLPGAVAS